MNIATLPHDVVTPRYQRSVLRPRIAHLGFGAFHSAHQAAYTDAVLNQFGGNWGHRVIKLRTGAEKLENLRERDYLFTVLERDTRCRDRATVIGSLIDHRHPSQHGIRGVIDGIADASIEIVSLTITEKGYALSPDNRLNLNDPKIVRDLEHGVQPLSVIGILAAALAERQRLRKPVTMLSCDNLPKNGHKLRNALLGSGLR